MNNLLNQTKIIISKHAIQRREHQNPIDKDILINLVKQIDDKFTIFLLNIFYHYLIKILPFFSRFLIHKTSYFFRQFLAYSSFLN